jgi:hypothetical protein
MLLVLGHPDDPLVRQVCSRLSNDAIPVICLDEPELFSNTAFAFEQNGAEPSGYLCINGTTIALNQLSGVLVRMPRLWWPSTDLDLQDQMFVYHESSAAWFALLASLRCPVINRFDLAWWLNDITYPDNLVHDLARLLEIHTKTDPPAETLPARIYPRLPDPSCSSVYVAGNAVIPRTPDDHGVSNWLAVNLPALAGWQRASGAHLSRLDFSRPDSARLNLTRQNDTLCLRHVEIFPLLDQEPAALVNQLAAATMEMLA